MRLTSVTNDSFIHKNHRSRIWIMIIEWNRIWRLPTEFNHRELALASPRIICTTHIFIIVTIATKFETRFEHTVIYYWTISLKFIDTQCMKRKDQNENWYSIIDKDVIIREGCFMHVNWRVITRTPDVHGDLFGIHRLHEKSKHEHKSGYAFNLTTGFDQRICWNKLSLVQRWISGDIQEWLYCLLTCIYR